MSGPLDGCRVLELAHIMAGPIAGLMLADMGADVIKIERKTGDDTRRMVPPTVNDESAAFMMMNRNKRGIVLDLKSEDGKQAFLRLVASADVLIENYRKGTMEKLGLGYDVLKEVNPALIYLEVSGFGRTGPYADRGGFDLIAQGMSGLMSITGEEGTDKPMKVGAPITDITAGILGAMGVCAAYAHRLKTGLGQKVDTSLFEAGITHTYWQSAIAFATGESPGALGTAHPLNAPYQSFQTADGWINIGAANQQNWQRLVDILGLEYLKEDNRFKTNDARMANLPVLVAILEPVFLQKNTQQWLDQFEQAGLPAGPILDIKTMHKDPQVIAREMIVDQEHVTAGLTQTLGTPVKFSETPTQLTRAAPILGQHSIEVLTEAGFSGVEIDRLLNQQT